MPQNPQNNMKGSSPSKLINQGINNAWGQQKGTTNPKQALSSKHTNSPVKVGKSK